jgi:long-chain-fatty-acid---luciferin-component ligase
MLEAARKRLKTTVPDRSQWTKVDEALYGVDDLYRVDKAKAQRLLLEAVKYSFRYHFEHNAFYRRYCQGEHVTPDLIEDYSDLVRIPLITDTFFKDYPAGSDFVRWLEKITSVTVPQIELNGNTSFDAVIAALEEKKFTVTFSSGSSGKFSFYPRDALSWQRQQYCYGSAVAEMLGSFYDPGLAVMILAPNPEKTNLFLGKVGDYCYGVLFDKEDVTPLINTRVTTESVRISSGRTRGIREWIAAKLETRARQRTVTDFAQKLEGYAVQKRKVFIVGPPSVMNVVLSKLEDKKKEIRLGNNGFIMTGGGRKVSRNAPMSEKEFRELIKERQGVPVENCRDLYGMSECSTAFVGCEGHYKHIPHSILYPMVLDDDLKPIGYGQYGRFAFLDPLPTSYPGFIITGNMVRILESCPSCDRVGPVIEPDVSKMDGAESKGCGRILNQLIGGKT